VVLLQSVGSNHNFWFASYNTVSAAKVTSELCAERDVYSTKIS
jgi:hypothetical protein